MYGLVQLTVALGFLYQARAYLRPIVIYLARQKQQDEEQRPPQQRQQRGIPQSPNHIQRTTHLVLWMSRSVAFMILNSLWIVLIGISRA